MAPPSLSIIKALLILTNDGKRIVGRYYDASLLPTQEEKKKFEKSLFSKTHKANGEILMIDNLTIVYRNTNDLFFYVVGSTNENELMLNSILNCFHDTIYLISKKNMEKKFIMNNLHLVFLALDLMCDDGILLDCDAAQIYQRVSMKENEIPLSEQTVIDVLKTARDQIKSSNLFR